MEIVAIDQISPDQVILFTWGFDHHQCHSGLHVADHGAARDRVCRDHRESFLGANHGPLAEHAGGDRGHHSPEIADIAHEGADTYFPFIATLFLFILFSNVFTFVPGYVAPTSSLTTTAALAIVVFFAVPIYGIAKNGSSNT